MGVLGVLAIGQAACVTTLYQGPRELIGSDAPVIEASGAIIDEIDGQNLEDLRQDLSRYLLPPGPHVITYRRLESPLLADGHKARLWDQPVHVCLVTQRGHHYRVVAEPVPGSREWTPVVFETTERPASGEVAGPHRAPLDCGRERLLASARGRSKPSAPASSTPPGEAGSAIGVDPEAEPASSPGASSGVPEVLALRSREKIARYDPLPFVDFALGLGVAQGGDFAYRGGNTIYSGTCTEFCAGDGVLVDIGAMVTPIWIGERVGFGGGLGLAYKLAVPPAGPQRLRRYPVSASAHTAIHLWGRWFTLLAVGPTKDLAARVDSYDQPSNIGMVSRVAIYYRVGDWSAFMFSITDTWQSYRVDDKTLDAGSIGVVLSADLAL